LQAKGLAPPQLREGGSVATSRHMDSHQALPATEITALLGRGTQFEGKLQFEGRVRLDGVFKGEIRSDDTLIIGDGAEVHAEIDVATVIVRGGVVHGNVRAKTSIEIHAPGKLHGNIHSPSVFIDRGVEFHGSCRMDAVETNGHATATTGAAAVVPVAAASAKRAGQASA
jgi:cytoskeletal protein CcmA (bactofilin family)